MKESINEKKLDESRNQAIRHGKTGNQSETMEGPTQTKILRKEVEETNGKRRINWNKTLEREKGGMNMEYKTIEIFSFACEK